jgi:hypothetical protein
MLPQFATIQPPLESTIAKGTETSPEQQEALLTEQEAFCVLHPMDSSARTNELAEIIKIAERIAKKQFFIMICQIYI